MKNKKALPILFLILFGMSSFSMAQDKPAYRIFHADGKPATFAAVLDRCQTADFTFFGELHNNPIAHWLQLELVRSLHVQHGGKLVLGAEMFETDNQLLIDEYFQGIINTSQFEKEARLWNNYKTDYKPLLEYAREKGLTFVATNIPRRYANLVYRKGMAALDSLSAIAKTYLAPLPIEVDLELPSYQEMLRMQSAHGEGEPNINFPMAQASKDATMAHFIDRNWAPGQHFIHFNGSFHSDKREGIIWFLRRNHPDAGIALLTTVEQDDISQLAEEHFGKADFIICVPANMTKTY